MAAILAAVASGNICLGEAGELTKLVDAFVRAAEATEKVERQQNENNLFPARGFGGIRSTAAAAARRERTRR